MLPTNCLLNINKENNDINFYKYQIDSDLTYIINKYRKTTNVSKKKNILDCQKELIEKGYTGNAAF
jgi:hypothetical protein